MAQLTPLQKTTDSKDIGSSENKLNTGISAICISDESDNKTAQIEDHAPK